MVSSATDYRIRRKIKIRHCIDMLLDIYNLKLNELEFIPYAFFDFLEKELMQHTKQINKQYRYIVE